MKIVGLIGGTTWVSTVEYYRIINQIVSGRLGGHSCAELVLYNVDFGYVQDLVKVEDWDGLTVYFSDAANKLAQIGADCIVLCANTPHKFAEGIRRSIKIPLIHISEVVAHEISKQGITKVGLLGTKVTMMDTYYKVKLAERKIDMVVPDKDEMEFIHHTIFAELGKEIFKEETKKRYQEIIGNLIKNGAQGIILGCTEIPLLIKQKDCPVPVFDTLMIHAKAAAEFALGT